MANMLMTMLLLLIFVVGGVFLQIFLSKSENKWYGLILPMITLLWSLVLVGNLVGFGETPLSLAMKLLSVFFLGNIPTIILLAIYFACRKGRKNKSDVEKMKIKDL